MRGGMIWRLAYTALLWLTAPFVLWRLWRRGGAEPGYRQSVGERFGRYECPANDGTPVIWLHAVSLGETRAARPLFELLKQTYPSHRFLVTHMTATGYGAARELFEGRAEFAWLPYDYPFAVRRFLNHFRPVVGILMETEVWFNLVHQCANAGIPLLLANARLSERSARQYEIVGSLARAAFSSLNAVAAQSEDDSKRLRRLGARSVEVTGNLKFDVTCDAALASLGSVFRDSYDGRPVLLAASTRDGEEQLIFDAFKEIRIEGAVLVIVPRHPHRFASVEAILARSQLRYLKRSQGLRVGVDCSVVLGDSLGEMQAYYAAADVAFIGGSLLPFGGQNLIEACAQGVPVLIGSFTFNFADAAKAAVAEGAARRVSDASDLMRKASTLLSNDEERRAMGRAGKAFCEKHQGATQRVAAIAVRLIGGVTSLPEGR